MAPKASKNGKGKAVKKTAPSKSKVNRAAYVRLQSAKKPKRICSASFAQAPKASVKPLVAYIATAKRYEEFPATRQCWQKAKFWCGTKRLRMAGRFNVEILGAFSSASAAERCLKKNFRGRWLKRKDDLERRVGFDYVADDHTDSENEIRTKSKEDMSWKHEIILDVEAHEVCGPELTTPRWCSRSLGFMPDARKRIWIAKGTHTAECAEGFGIVANARILGVFSSLLGSRGANAYVTGAALEDICDNEAWTWVSESELEEGTTYEPKGAANLELVVDPGDGHSLTTEVCLEKLQLM